MGKINTGRVVLGGLLAGLVINIGEFILNDVLLGEDWKAAMQALNRPEICNHLVTYQQTEIYQVIGGK